MTSDIALTAQPIPPKQDTGVAEGWHTVVLLLVLAVWAGVGYIGAHTEQVRGNPHRLWTYGVTAVWEWLVVAYIAWGVRRRGMRFRELLGNRWRSGLDFLRDWGIAVIFWIISLAVLFVVALAVHVPKAGQNVQFLLPKSGLEVIGWLLLSGTAGFCEEIMFRGYLQRQFIAWTGNVAAGVVISALGFGAAHIYGGVKSAIVITAYGLLFGILAQFRQSLIPGMLTHAWHDSFSGLAASFLLPYLQKYAPR